MAEGTLVLLTLGLQIAHNTQCSYEPGLFIKVYWGSVRAIMASWGNGMSVVMVVATK